MVKRFIFVVGLIALGASTYFIACADTSLEYGVAQYDDDAYSLDWAALPVGKAIPRPAFKSLLATDVIGDEAKVVLEKRETVHLKDVRLGVRWKHGYQKYRNALFLIRNCDRVIVENMLIRQLDPDYRASSSILIEDCNEVVIKNSYFAGTTESYHIRIEGCKRIRVDNVEIEGLEYTGKQGRYSGGGLFINNGDPKMGGTKGMLSPAPKDLEWCVIQNSYFHHNTASDKKRNQDAVLLHSCADGLLFNCYFEKWRHGDAALDVSHRRTDPSYRDHFFRIERNIFDNCDKVKTPGTSHKSNTLFFANNLYKNTFVGDYHKGWDVYHVHETFNFNEQRRRSTFYSIWAMADGNTHMANSLVYVTGAPLRSVYYQGKGAIRDTYRLVQPDFMAYVMPEPATWLTGADIEIRHWSDWQVGATDKGTVFIDNTKNQGATAINKLGFRVFTGWQGSRVATRQYLNNGPKSVTRDFSGKPRGSTPTVGAFEHP